MVEKIILYLSQFLALLLVLPIHEFAHAFVAVKCGDDTPKLHGRYTINPFAHFDLVGLACFIFAGFGWAKPVPINPYNFKDYKKGSFLVSIAGVTANYILAFIAYPLMLLVLLYLPDLLLFDDVLFYTLQYTFTFSLSFFIFNLIPVYPLDGFKVLDALNTTRGPIYRFLSEKGIYILYTLFGLRILADITGLWFIDIFGYAMRFLISYLQKPITLFWNLIFGVVL